MNGQRTPLMDLAARLAHAQLDLEAISAWPDPLERHAALEEFGVVFAQHLDRAMAEVDVARAVLGK